MTCKYGLKCCNEGKESACGFCKPGNYLEPRIATEAEKAAYTDKSCDRCLYHDDEKGCVGCNYLRNFVPREVQG